MFITQHISTILYVTGAITALPILQFVIPQTFVQKMFQLDINDAAGLFFARHWGFVVFVLGGLLIYAGAEPSIRFPIVLAVLAEKLVLVVMILTNPQVRKGMMITMIFDGACVLLYTLYLTGLA